MLVERFVSGTEYRFFVLDGETKAVLRRDAAHVIGDGVSTIKQLVAQKMRTLYVAMIIVFLWKDPDHCYRKLMLEVRLYGTEYTCQRHKGKSARKF